MNFKSLNDIFENKLFRIPDYQRGYAWRADKEVVAFWNDIINLQKGKSHFTGSLTLQSLKNYDKKEINAEWLLNLGYTPWFVVDGQQRLTTITIFIQCFCEFLEKLKNTNVFFMGSSIEDSVSRIREKFICRENKQFKVTNYLFGYISNEISNNYLLREIFRDKSAVIKEESYYTLNMSAAKKFFSDNLQDFYEKNKKNIEVLEELYQKVTQFMKFDLIEVSDNDDFNIFVAFETINNRGRQLSNLEKLKNRLIYLATFYQEMSQGLMLRELVNKAWAEIYRQLGRNFNKRSNGKVLVLDDDDFLRTHWILYYQYSRQTGRDYIDFLLEKKFTAQNVMRNLASIEETQEFARDIEDDDSDDELIISNTLQQKVISAEEISNYVIDLRETSQAWYYTWFPHDAKELESEEIKWMERINRLGIAYFRPLITALFRRRLQGDISKDDSIKLLTQIERFIFIVFRLQTTRSHYGSSEFNNVARELHLGKKSASDIVKMLIERIQRSFDGDGFFKAQNMQVMVDKLFDQKEDERAGYYRWSSVRYFLYEYNAELAKSCHGQGEPSWDSFKQGEKDLISIEHIFPHKAEGYWAEQFKNVPQDKWYIYQGSLGNLLLLSQKINASLQNDDFNTKKMGNTNGDRTGYEKGSAAEITVSQYEDWNPDAIEKVGMDMLAKMEERWEIKFKSDGVKKKLLLPGIY